MASEMYQLITRQVEEPGDEIANSRRLQGGALSEVCTSVALPWYSVACSLVPTFCPERSPGLSLAQIWIGSCSASCACTTTAVAEFSSVRHRMCGFELCRKELMALRDGEPLLWCAEEPSVVAVILLPGSYPEIPAYHQWRRTVLKCFSFWAGSAAAAAACFKQGDGGWEACGVGVGVGNHWLRTTSSHLLT